MTVTQPREPVVEVAVSWDGTGSYTGAHDNLSSPSDPRVLTGTLATTRGRSAPRGSAGPVAATMGAALLNEDRLFSNEYAGSDLYQLVEPGRPTRVQMEAGVAVDYDEDILYDEMLPYDGIEAFSAMTGFLEEPQADSARGHKVLTISALGKLSTLRGVQVSTPLYTAITTGQAIGYVLDAVGWPATERVVATGDTTLSYWWLDKADALDAIDELLATEGVPAACYEDGRGWFVFENRNYRANTTRSNTSQATFSDYLTGLVEYDADVDYDDPILYDEGSTLYHTGITVEPRRVDIVNEAKIRVVRRVAQALQKVWEYGEPLALAANETRDVEAPFSDPVSGLLAPVLATDYTVSAGALAVAPPLVTIYGQRATVRFVAGAAGATVIGVTSNGPQLRAQPLTVLSEETVTDDIPARDIDRPPPLGRGVRSKTIAALPELSVASALAVANAEVLYSRDPRPVVTFTVANIDGEHLYHQLHREISDRVTALSAHHGFTSSSDVAIEQIHHRREPGLLVTTYVCQRAFAETGTGTWASDDADATTGVAQWATDDADATTGVGQWSP